MKKLKLARIFLLSACAAAAVSLPLLGAAMGNITEQRRENL